MTEICDQAVEATIAKELLYRKGRFTSDADNGDYSLFDPKLQFDSVLYDGIATHKFSALERSVSVERGEFIAGLLRVELDKKNMHVQGGVASEDPFAFWVLEPTKVYYPNLLPVRRNLRALAVLRFDGQEVPNEKKEKLLREEGLFWPRGNCRWQRHHVPEQAVQVAIDFYFRFKMDVVDQ